MTDREAKVQQLIQAVERLCMEIERHVPPEVVHLEDMYKLIKELKHDGQQAT